MVENLNRSAPALLETAWSVVQREVHADSLRVALLKAR